MSAPSRIDRVALPARDRLGFCLAWIALTFLYCLLIWTQIHRPVWYDELITLMIAKAPTFPDFFRLLYKWDLTPPLLHLLVRFSIHSFGDSNLGVRLPSVIAFYGASLFVFVYVKRKLTLAYALIPVLLLWYSPFFQYATEARPYALVAFFFSLLLLSWDALAKSAVNRVYLLIGVGVASSGLVLSQAFAPLSIVPFFLAELLRERTQRKVALPRWAALLLPLLCTLAYIPLVHGYGTLFYPARFQASFRKVGALFWHAITGIPAQALLVLLAVFLILRISRIRSHPVLFKSFNAVLFIGLLSLPLVLNAILFVSHGAFWDRYCITTVIAFYILIAAALYICFDSAPSVAYAASICMVCFILFQRLPHPLYDNVTAAGPRGTFHGLAYIRPGLPLVAASGLTFVEMNHDESQDVLARLYYLTDREAALRYAHTNLFERLGELSRDFGLYGTVEAYSQFVTWHREFLVLGTPGYPEDWLLDKLAADGANTVLIGRYDIPYKDTAIYDVTLHR